MQIEIYTRVLDAERVGSKFMTTSCKSLSGGGWAMAKNGEGEFAFFICQIRHFSPIFDFGISHLTDFRTANRIVTKL